MHDLAVIVVSTNEGHWLRPCLRSVFERAGDIELDVVVVDNGSIDGTPDLVEHEFPEARVVTCVNRGFSHANNRGLMTCDAHYILFLNPDTEILGGTLAGLVAALDERPAVGLAGVRQYTADGALFPTIRRFPNAARALAEALACERWPLRALSAGERELRLERYERETPCGWTSGSFMLARREAIEGAGFLDERFFIYSEEVDLCLRIQQAGWRVAHLPQLTILHHADKAGISARMTAQDVYARLQYARKHFAAPHRGAYRGALLLRHSLRCLTRSRARRAAALQALLVVIGRGGSPFGPPPQTAVAAHPPRRETADVPL